MLSYVIYVLTKRPIVDFLRILLRCEMVNERGDFRKKNGGNVKVMRIDADLPFFTNVFESTQLIYISVQSPQCSNLN